jgi:hypothetical protein
MRSGKFCNRDCAAAYRKLVQQGGKELVLAKRNIAAKKIGSVLFHNCIPGGGLGLDPFVPERCKCRMGVSEEQAKRLVSRGEAIDFTTRLPIFTGDAIVQIGKLKRTPRAMTIEKANVERSVQHHTTKQEDKDIRELKAVVAEDKAWRDQEELERMDHYQALTVASMRIVQIPEDQYDEMKANDPWRGRCLFTFSDERSSAGIDVTPFSRWDAEIEEPIEDKTEITKAVEEVEPEREDGLTVLTDEELQKEVV